jgi:PAS domain S-box-containing protein
MQTKRKPLSKADAPKTITNEEKVLGANDFIVSKTDTKGFITYCNEIFVEMSGYDAGVLIGANHNLIRHPHMPKIAFKSVWDTIKVDKEFFGFVKNLTKSGGYYWVYTYITSDHDTNGNIVGYTSIRRKPPQSAIDQIAPIYELLINAEKTGGVKASGELLGKFLEDNKITYTGLIMALQQGAKL